MTGWYRGDIRRYLPQNGWVVVKVEQEEGERKLSEHLYAPRSRSTMLVIGEVVSVWAEAEAERVGVPVGSRVLFPSAYTDSFVSDVYHHHLSGPYYTITWDSILVVETVPGGLDAVDLWFYGGRTISQDGEIVSIEHS